MEDVVPGYAGGTARNPSYEKVSTGDTGHAEVVKINFNEDELSLPELLEAFFTVHDPAQKDRQGPDRGTQYRSIILYTSEKQRDQTEKFLEEQEGNYDKPVQTELARLEKFYEAEEEHHDYFEKNPNDAYCRIHVQPKVEKIREPRAK